MPCTHAVTIYDERTQIVGCIGCGQLFELARCFVCDDPLEPQQSIAIVDCGSRFRRAHEACARRLDSPQEEKPPPDLTFNFDDKA